MKILKVFAVVITSLLASCSNPDNNFEMSETWDFDDCSLTEIQEEKVPNLTIKEGYISQENQSIRIMRNGQAIALVKLGKPIIIAQAQNEEEWGYFQFPELYRNIDGNLIATWQMKIDDQSAFGKDPNHRMMSRDEGLSWTELDKDYNQHCRYRCDLRNGDVLNVVTPESQDITRYVDFPTPEEGENNSMYSFYRQELLPQELQGAYLSLWSRSNNSANDIHAEVNDPGMLKFAIQNLMPLTFWGKIEELEDGSLIIGVQSYYLDSEGDVALSGVSFYRSTDGGKKWVIQGKIPYDVDPARTKFDGRDGFCEPSFEVLNNGTLVCAMRTSNDTPMYRAFSYDKGKTWTKAEPFTPNGVLPNLLLLNNGVLVLASGRPGVQLRFSLDGTGEVWTEPIEMMPFMDSDGNYDIFVSCSYSDILAVDDNTFYLVYSDFKTKNSTGEYRKSIVFRKVSIKKK